MCNLNLLIGCGNYLFIVGVAWHMAAMSSGGTAAAASPPEGNGASTDPTKGSFVPRDSSYSEFMRRLLPERQKLVCS